MRAMLAWGACCAAVISCSGAPKTPAPADKGTSTGPKVTATVGAAGGRLASTDGRLELTVPAGALEADVELTLEPISNTAPGGVGGAYRLGPEGTRFSQPATVSIAWSAAELEGSTSDALSVGYQDSEGRWRALGEPSVSGQRVSVSTRHLSDWSALLGWQLRPPSAKTDVNGAVNLTLRYCEPEQFVDAEGELSGLVPRCDLDEELPQLAVVNSWSVNGTSGGTPSDGTVEGQGLAAVYSAPPVEPMANPVAVQVDFNRRRKGRQLAVANVRVGGAAWSGTVSWTLMGTSTETTGMYRHTYGATGDGMLTLAPGSGGALKYMSGNGSYSWSHDELFSNTYMANGCTHTLMQTRRWTLSGSSTDVAALSGVLVENGANVDLTLTVPSGPATGRQTVSATETASGPSHCRAAMPTNTDDPYQGSMPADVLSMSLPLGGDPDRLAGSRMITVGERPPRSYNVSWNLMR